MKQNTIFQSEPTTDIEVVQVTAASEQLSKRDELRAQIAKMGGHLSNRDIIAAVLIGLVSSIPSTPYDNQAAEWFLKKTGMALPEYRGGQSVSQAGMNLFKTAQNGVPNLGNIASIDGDKPEMLNTLLTNAAKGQLNDAEGVAENLAQVFDFEDILGLGLGKLLTRQYVKHFGLEPNTLPYHEFKALAFGVQGIVSAYWNFNPFVIGLSLWHLAKCLWLGNKDVALYIQLTEVALEEGRQVMAKWEDTIKESQWSDKTIALEIGLPVLLITNLSDSDGFGD